MDSIYLGVMKFYKKLAGFFLFLLLAPAVIACTRVVYHGPNDTVLTGRTMDFSVEIPANIWVFPQGMLRHGAAGPHSISWTSTYGSVVTSSWDLASSDGMNEKGLVANLLWLVESEYPDFDPESGTPGLSISMWAQYALDQFATVAEAVAAFRKEEFVVVSDFIAGTDKFATLHLSLSDAGGDSAILEYIDGKLEIHHDAAYNVMTNSPPFRDQLAIARYWEDVPPSAFLPGSNRAADRFVRAQTFIRAVVQSDDPTISVASVFSVIRNVSVPYGISVEGHPNLSTTRWRVVADQKHLRYFYESALTPNAFWIDFEKLNFAEDQPVRVLPLSQRETYSGEASSHLVARDPFDFQGL